MSCIFMSVLFTFDIFSDLDTVILNTRNSFYRKFATEQMAADLWTKQTAGRLHTQSPRRFTSTLPALKQSPIQVVGLTAI